VRTRLQISGRWQQQRVMRDNGGRRTNINTQGWFFDSKLQRSPTSIHRQLLVKCDVFFSIFSTVHCTCVICVM
jgi:hypothetical protein